MAVLVEATRTEGDDAERSDSLPRRWPAPNGGCARSGLRTWPAIPAPCATPRGAVSQELDGHADTGWTTPTCVSGWGGPWLHFAITGPSSDLIYESQVRSLGRRLVAEAEPARTDPD